MRDGDMLERADDFIGRDGSEPRRRRVAAPAPSMEAEFAHLVRLAGRIMRAPIAMISGTETRLAWSDPSLALFPAQLERLHDICAGLAGSAGPTVIPDATQDPRLWHNPHVASSPNLRFIVCMPITGLRGESLGVLGVMDRRERARLSDEQSDALTELAALAARMIERQRDAEAQLRLFRDGARTDTIEAAVIRAQSCELALAGMLVALCKHHGASAGFVGKLSTTSRTLQEVCRYNDESGLGDYFARTVTTPAGPDTSPAALAIQSGTARTTVFSGSGGPVAFPGVADAIRTGLRAEIVQPVHLLDERFGIVLMFDSEPAELDEIAADIGSMVRLVRPALYRKAAERRMRLLGTALDRANDAVLIAEAGPLTAAGPKIVYANASFTRETGYEMDEVLGEPHGMLHGADTDMEAVAQLRQEMRRWRPARAELLSYRKDGSAFWAELDLTPITDESGLPTHWISIQRDVTERRATEAAQRRQEASFRMLFQDNPLPVAVMARGSLAFLEANEAALKQYGWSRPEFLRRTLHDLSPEGAVPEGAGLPDGGAGSITHMRADQSVLEVQAFTHDTVYAGQEATLAVLWDVTDLEATRRDMHHANEMLRERTLQLHARTEELAEAQRLARIGTWRMAADGRHLSWSREMYELNGVPQDAQELDLDRLTQRIHPDDREPVRAVLTAAAKDGARKSFEYRVVLNDKEVRHLRGEVRAVLDPRTNRVSELYGYSQDVSDDKRAEQVMLRSESLRALGQLTGGVAHDFNNLLTVVILNLEEAQEVLPPDHALVEVLAPALHAAVRGAELTSQLLSYARRATLRPERVRPDEFFGALRPLLNRVLGERFELQVLLRHNGGSVIVDPAQLDSAIMNLVINARDAMKHGGSIVLEVRSVSLQADSPGFQDEVTPGRYVSIAVKDRGEGIPEHLLARVFEPFFTTKDPGKGSGMGLSMVYGFARQSGGHVIIDSVPDQGTTVQLFLPVAAGASGEIEADLPDAPEWSADGKRVLVVEDQESVLRTVTRMLRQFGFLVTSAMSAAEALVHLEREPPFDLLFSDIVLPGEMDGVGLADTVAQQSPGTRILLTSGFTEHSIAAADLTGPGVDFLMKPYKRQDLQGKFSTMFPRGGAE